MRKLLVLVLCLGFLVSLYAFQIVLEVGTPFQKGHVLAQAAERFKQLIEERTNGRVLVRLRIAEASEEEVNTQCAKGIIDIQFTGGRPVEVFAPQYFFVNAPFVIKDYEHFLRVWNGPLGAKAKELILKNGNMICLATVYRGYRQFTSNKEIKSVDDFAGVKLRLPVVPTWVKIWEAVGVQAVPVPLPELYDALKTGRAEASEGDLTQIYSFKLYEVQSYLTITNHQCGVGWITMNKTTFDCLSKDLQDLIVKTINEVAEWATQQIRNNEANILKELEAKGMKIVRLDEATLSAIRAKASPAVEELFKTEWPVTTCAEVLAQ